MAASPAATFLFVVVGFPMDLVQLGKCLFYSIVHLISSYYSILGAVFREHNAAEAQPSNSAKLFLPGTLTLAHPVRVQSPP